MILCHSDIVKAFESGAWKAYRDGQPIGADELKIGGNSIDVSLGNIALWPHKIGQFVDLHNPSSLQWKRMEFEELQLRTTDFCLAHVRERFDCLAPLFIDGKDRHFIPMIDGRSSPARTGLSCHQAAGLGNIGFNSNFTLELTTRIPIILRPGDLIAQIFFMEGSSGQEAYSGAYVNQHDTPREPSLGKDRFQSRRKKES